jgi:hypothetical protein
MASSRRRAFESVGGRSRGACCARRRHSPFSIQGHADEGQSLPMPPGQSGRPDLDCLEPSLFRCQTPDFWGWKSLDFLGFSRPNIMISMSCSGFSLNVISRALLPSRQRSESGGPWFGMAMGRIAHRASITTFLIFCKTLQPDPPRRLLPKATRQKQLPLGACALLAREAGALLPLRARKCDYDSQTAQARRPFATLPASFYPIGQTCLPIVLALRPMAATWRARAASGAQPA